MNNVSVEMKSENELVGSRSICGISGKSYMKLYTPRRSIYQGTLRSLGQRVRMRDIKQCIMET